MNHVNQTVLPAIPTLPAGELPLPAAYARLYDLAYNLWWSWDPVARELWPAIDPVSWAREKNPIRLLRSVEPDTWAALQASPDVHDRYAEAVARFDAYMAGSGTWYESYPRPLAGPVAYLCAEYGIHESLPFYSGGLGILAGDHAKSASDLGVPLVALGLLYRRGYFRQEIDADGDQHHIFPLLDLRQLPVRAVAGPTGGQLRVGVEFPGRVVQAAVWKVDVGRVPLLLLDTDVPENDPADRPIAAILYVAGRDMRFCQELVLGAGAPRALAALGIEPAVWHVNEGHAAMSLLERLAAAVERGLSPEAAAAEVRSATVFTLHTPVPAGNEVFEARIAEKYLAPWGERVGSDLAGVRDLARSRDDDDRFDLGALAIRLSRSVNGVSRRHGEVVARDWAHLLNGPARAVTNGVHVPTWASPDAQRLFSEVIDPDWAARVMGDPGSVERLEKADGARLWSARLSRKELLARFVRERLRRQVARYGGSPDDLRAVASLLPPERLTLGFARRFATYKRAALMFQDPARAAELLTDPRRPVQVIFAGKAHPADEEGQALIRHIVELSHRPELRGHVIVLEDYDAQMARLLVQGVDVWINTPRPPMEASGTSGMKAALNGVLNCSILDGWWVEGYDGTNGWAFGSTGEGDPAAADEEDARALYRVLAEEVIPLYYERDGAGIPTGWVARMRRAMATTLHAFSSDRMVAQYLEELYVDGGRGPQAPLRIPAPAAPG